MDDFFALLWLVSFFLAFALLLFWGVRLKKLFGYLQENLSSDFEKLGRPHILANNTPRHTLLLLKFLHSGKHSDVQVEELRVSLVRIFWIYMALFAYCFGYVITLAVSS